LYVKLFAFLFTFYRLSIKVLYVAVMRQATAGTSACQKTAKQ